MTLASHRWRLQAPCVRADPRFWYPPIDVDPRPFYERGRTVCQRCPVWEHCSEEGRTEKHGMWGGLSPRERSGKKVFPHGYWMRYRQGCRCPDCSISHAEACEMPREAAS